MMREDGDNISRSVSETRFEGVENVHKTHAYDVFILNDNTLAVYTREDSLSRIRICSTKDKDALALSFSLSLVPNPPRLTSVANVFYAPRSSS